MKNLKTFQQGGIHPPENKHLSEHKEIQKASVPEILVVPLSQHLGKPAQCLVNAGDTVSEGMLIGQADGFISANVHSPVTGTVEEIKDLFLPNGIKSGSVVIKCSEKPSDTWEKKSRDWEKPDKDELLKIIADLGIVGMGGATFPAHVKLSIPRGKKADVLVINGVECEPYLTSDHRLMLEKTEQIFLGISIIRKIIEAEEICIGIENNKTDAIRKMTDFAGKNYPYIKVQPLKVRYPQGDEKQLLKAIIDREVPSGGLPIDIGAVVVNVGTAHAVYEAVVHEKPVMERVVTVSGRGVKNPSNFLVRIGTPVKELIDACGGLNDNSVKLVSGGPMMGFSFFNLDSPVTKGTSGILALTKKEINKSRSTACLMCGRCIKACPMGLNPTLIFKMIDNLEIKEAIAAGLMDCKECGCCSFTCPAHIQLVQGMRTGKRLSRKMG